MPEIKNRICLVHADPIRYILAMKVSREEKKCLHLSFCTLACVTWLIQEAKLGDGGRNLGWQSKRGCVGLADKRKWNQSSFTHIMELLGGKLHPRRVFNASVLTFLKGSAAFQGFIPVATV